MADLGLYFGENEDDTQMEQEDKDLSYLVLANDQDDAFDSVDTETLLVEMNEADRLASHNKNDESLEVDTDVVQLFGDPNLSAVEKAQLLSRSVFDFHRSFLAREVSTILPEMNIYDAISCVIPIIHEFSSDSMESVRESLASQLDKIVIYFFQNALVVNYGSRSEQQSQQDTNDTPSLSHPPSIPHNTFTPIFINLLLDQNSGIAHQTRLAVVSVAENISEKLLETEIMDGVIAGLERLYNVEVVADGDSQDSQEDMSDQDNEAELGKMLVVVLLTSLANALGKNHCSTIVLPKLEKLAKQSEFYVRKEIVMALGTLCKVVDQDVVISRLLPLYDSFIQDDTWHIRRACCTVLASFVSSLPVEMKINKVEQIYDLYSADVSRSVRSSIMEVLGEVIAGFEKEKVPESLLNYFLSMGQSPMNEHDLAAMCAFSFPAVILTAGRSKWEQMKPVYMRLAGTFRSPIRRSLACSLHEVARILGPEIADRDLTIPFSDCLMAEDEVKEGVIGHVVEFISCLSPKCRSEALRDLFNAWTDLERSSNWRLRDSLAGQLPGLCEIAEGDNLLEYLMPLSVRACTDGVSTIRESGVMAFPALWEASERIGPFVHKKSARIAKSVEDDLEDDLENGTLGSFSEGEDVDMEDVTEQLYEPSDRVQESKSENSANGSASSPSSSPPTVHKSEHEDEDEEHPTMTTIRDEVIRQTAHFATNGGFRSRVVAVQIIQSLLDHGIYVEEFEQHFLSILADQLATDPVVNVRIWVSRVVSWIIESGYYNDVLVSSRLQDLLTTLQKDSDRDVRIYAGGPAELPKLKKKKRKSSKDKKKKKKSRNDQTLGGTFRQGSSDQVSTINEEDEDVEDVQLLKGEGDSDDVEDDDDEDDDDEDDSEDDSDEDDSDDSMEFLNSAKTKGISNKPRNRNSIGIGMKVMVGNKLTVSGKEIRKPKTSWDYVHGEIDEEEEELGDSSRKSFSASLGSKDGKTHHWNPDGDHDDEDEGESLFDSPRQPLEHDDEDAEDVGDAEDAEAEDGVENSTPSQDISKVIPYTANSASGASPLDVEMEDAVQDGSGERVAVVVSGGDEEAALAGQEQQASANDKEKKTDDEPSAAGPPKDASSPSPAASPAVLKQETLAKNPETGRGVGGTVTVNAAASPVRSRNGILVNKELTSSSSPEEKVLRALNAKLGVSKKHPTLPPPISITVPSANKKSMLAFKDPGSPSYAAIVASGASSPRPTGPIVPGLGLGSVKGSVSPFSPPLSPMPNASSSFRLQP